MLQCPSKGRRNRQGPGDAQAAAKPVPSPKHNPGPAEKPPFSQSCPQPFKRTPLPKASTARRCFFLPARSRGGEGGAAIVPFFLMYSSHSVISTEQPFHLRGARATPVKRGV